MFKDYGWIYFAIIALFGAMIFVGWLNSAYLALNCLWVLRRWIRCAFFTLALAVILDIFFPARNFAALCACGTMLYFLGETILYWMEIWFYLSKFHKFLYSHL